MMGLSIASPRFPCGKFFGFRIEQSSYLSPKLPGFCKSSKRVYAARNSVKKSRRKERAREDVRQQTELDSSPSEDDFLPNSTLAASTTAEMPSRSSVLQACSVTSGLIAALGVIIRQISHVASVGGLPILDCSTEVSFGFEIWHLELFTGLVIVISSSRYLLLKTWPDFAESSEAANQQVLSSLQPLDYLIVAFLPGFSEELLFRGALLPLFGVNWKSALVVAAIFGILHLGSGRKYSFAIWATFVGFLYGYATIVSSSVVLPMASHAMNNLIGGFLWRYTSDTE